MLNPGSIVKHNGNGNYYIVMAHNNKLQLLMRSENTFDYVIADVNTEVLYSAPRQYVAGDTISGEDILNLPAATVLWNDDTNTVMQRIGLNWFIPGRKGPVPWSGSLSVADINESWTILRIDY